LLAKKQQFVLGMALRDPEDTWSGRGNDAGRSLNDGKREALQMIELQLRQAADEIFS